MKIASLKAQEILDSRTLPTVQVTVTLEDGTRAVSSVPSGASTGATEAFELRDNNPQRFNGQGVLTAVDNINTTLAGILVGQNAFEQAKIDELMIQADGTPLKARIGGNAITGVSMAVCRAAAFAQGKKLYRYFGELSQNDHFMLPQTQIIVMEGGKHGHWAMDLQEIMVVPFQQSFPSLAESIQATRAVYNALAEVLISKNHDTGVGLAGVYAPSSLRSNEEAIEMVALAISRAGFSLGRDFAIALDIAASEFFKDGQYVLRCEGNRTLTSEEWQDQVISWIDSYQLWSIEDPHEQEEWNAWSSMVSRAGDRCKIVGDDILTTNPDRITMAVNRKAVTAATIKINQVGTITETIKAITASNDAGISCIISQRSGETDDDMIADLVVGTIATECKFGSPDHDERMVKYQRLRDIEQELLNSSPA
jgi:enolase